MLLDELKDSISHFISIQLISFCLDTMSDKIKKKSFDSAKSSSTSSQSHVSSPPFGDPGVCAVLSSPSPLHRRASVLDFCFDHSEERPLEAFEDIFASYENKK